MLHVHLARPSTLLGLAVVLIPVPMLRTSGGSALALRVPLSHGDGTLSLKLSLAPPQRDVGAALAAVAASNAVNKKGASTRKVRYSHSKRVRKGLRVWECHRGAATRVTSCREHRRAHKVAESTQQRARAQSLGSLSDSC